MTDISQIQATLRFDTEGFENFLNGYRSALRHGYQTARADPLRPIDSGALRDDLRQHALDYMSVECSSDEDTDG